MTGFDYLNLNIPLIPTSLIFINSLNFIPSFVEHEKVL